VPAGGNFPPAPARSPSAQVFKYTANQAPAALLPNGDVLVFANPSDDYYTDATHNQLGTAFFKFSFATNTLTELTYPAVELQLPAGIAFAAQFLVLPNGKILVAAHQADVLGTYYNGEVPNDAWRPVITTAPERVVMGSTYTISGRLFNGFSEGASYASGGSMSTNYPLVSITTSSGHVCYARTHNHSSMGVELVTSTRVTST